MQGFFRQDLFIHRSTAPKLYRLSLPRPSTRASREVDEMASSCPASTNQYLIDVSVGADASDLFEVHQPEEVELEQIFSPDHLEVADLQIARRPKGFLDLPGGELMRLPILP